MSAVAVQGYEILGLLEESGSGRLYKARQTSLNRLVALKVLPAVDAADPDFLQRFRDEARAAGSLRHPNVVGVCDQGTDSAGTHYVAFEYVEGPSGETLISRLSALPEREALELCYGVALGLACAEEHKIVHKDVQPANMVVTKEGVPKLVELGLAKRAGDISSSAVGKLLQNAHYVSPEQALGLGELDTRADLYALGICLYRFVTGKHPFQGENDLTIVTRHVNEEVPDPRELNPGLSQGLTELIAGLSARDPADRYPSARAACHDFARVIAGQAPLGPVQAAEADGLPPRPSDSSVLAGLLSRSSARLAAELSRDDPENPPARFQVQVYTGDVQLKEYKFDQDVVVIGRGKDCGIYLDNPIVSRRHAEIHRSGSGLALVALPTTNGTTVDGVRVSELTPIDERSRVMVADKFRLVFHVDAPKKAASPGGSQEEDTRTFPAAAALAEAEAKAAAPPRPEPVPGLPERPTIPLPGAREELSRPDEPPNPYEAPAAEAPRSSRSTPVPSGRPTPQSSGRPTPQSSGRPTPQPSGRPTPQPSGRPTPGAGARHAPSAPQAPTPARPTRRPGVETPEALVRPTARPEPRAALPGEPALIYERNGKQLRVACGDLFQLGKAHECDLRLQGTFAPRKAAVVMRAGEGFRILNVGPSPDTVRLNGADVPDQAPLQSGDRLSVYGLEVEFATE